MIALALFAIVITALVLFSWGHSRGVRLERHRVAGSFANEAKRDERFLEAIRQRDEALAAFALATGITKTINDRAAESPELRAKLDRACRPWDEARTAHRINLDDIDRAAEVGL